MGMEQVRQRRDVWEISVGTAEAAATEEWHPVLDGYARGVAAMSARSAEDVGSWLFAANTHGIPPGTTVPSTGPIWDACVHQHLFFLAWHRAYLVWFEDTLRAAIGDETWALPYWDYSEPSRPERRALPPEFRVPQRTVAGRREDNPLFVAERDPAYNEPGPDPAVGPGYLPPGDVDPVLALGRAAFLLDVRGGFGGFPLLTRASGAAEMQPHNGVHRGVGLGGFLGDPDTAGRDPIFWVHHSNVDRLWEVWRSFPDSVHLQDDPAVPAEIKTRYGTARAGFGFRDDPTTYTTAELEDTRSPRLRYEYESLDLSELLRDAVVAERERAATVHAGGVVGFDGVPQERPWTPVAATPRIEVPAAGSDFDVDLPAPVAGFDAADAPGDGLVLHLEGVTSDAPASGYVVEVAVTADAERHQADRFFTFGLAKATAEQDGGVTYVIDASPLVPVLRDEGWDGGPLVVTVRPDRDEPDAAPLSIEQVTVYRQ